MSGTVGVVEQDSTMDQVGELYQLGLRIEPVETVLSVTACFLFLSVMRETIFFQGRNYLL